MSRKNITIEKSFSIRLKTLLEDHLGITQAAFSNKVGISQGYLSMVLKGKRGASAELIAGLYIHYSNYLNWLLIGEGEMIKSDVKGDDPEISELLKKARKVLKSDNKVAQEALESGIHYFSQAIDDLESMKETKKRQKNMELRMAALETRLKKSEEIRKEDLPELQEELLKLRSI